MSYAPEAPESFPDTADEGLRQLSPENPSCVCPYSRLRILKPESLITPAEEGLVIETMHCATLLSGRALTEDGVLQAHIPEYFDRCARVGFNAVYLLGIWEPSVCSFLMQQYFSRKEWIGKPEHSEWVGASVFSILDYEPREGLESWDGFKVLTQEAAGRGLKVLVDLIPNTIAVDSKIAREQPELLRNAEVPYSNLELLKIIENRSKEERHRFDLRSSTQHQVLSIFKVASAPNNMGDSLYVYRDSNLKSGESFAVYLQRRGDRFLRYVWLVHEKGTDVLSASAKLLGSTRQEEDSPWCDVLALDTSNPRVVDYHYRAIQRIRTASGLSHRKLLFRGDMCHLPLLDYSNSTLGQSGSNYWSKLRALFTAADEEPPCIIGETYGCGTHEILSGTGVIPQAAFLREWLRGNGRPDIPRINSHIFNEQDGMTFHRSVPYFSCSANHDDVHGAPGPIESLINAVTCFSPAYAVLFAQGQIEGDEYRYSAQNAVPWRDYEQRIRQAAANNVGHAAFTAKLVRIANSKALRDKGREIRRLCLSSLNDTHEMDEIFAAVAPLFGRDGGLEEALIIVADCRKGTNKERIVVDLAATLSLSAEELGSLYLVDLLKGSCLTAPASFDCPKSDQEEFGVYLYLLTKSLEERL